MNVLAAADKLSAGPLGLLVVVVMILATVLLIRSMNRRLRNLPRSFEEPKDAGPEGQDSRPAQP